MSKITAFLSSGFRTSTANGPWPLIIRLFRESGKKHTGRIHHRHVFMGLVARHLGAERMDPEDVVDQVFVDQDIADAVALVIAVIVISLVRGISLYGSTVTLTRVGNAIIAENQKRVFDHILGLGMNYFDRTHSSELIAADVGPGPGGGPAPQHHHDQLRAAICCR